MNWDMKIDKRRCLWVFLSTTKVTPNPQPQGRARRRGYTCTLHNFCKKSKLVGKIHGQFRIQIAYIRVWGFRFRTAGREGTGRASGHTWRMLVAGEAPDEDLTRPRAAPLALWSPLGRRGQHRERWRPEGVESHDRNQAVLCSYSVGHVACWCRPFGIRRRGSLSIKPGYAGVHFIGLTL